MCNFKSGIVLRDEREKGGFRLLMSPWTESHSELEALFNLRQNETRLDRAKVEFSPESMATAHQVETYKLTIDERRTPDWFDSKMKSAVAAKMAEYIKRMIVTGDVLLLVGGQFIIAPGAKIECAHNLIINAMVGGSLRNVSFAKISDVGGNATISDVWDNAKISGVWGNAKISGVWGNATISDVWDNATISGVWGNATISGVWGNATISDVWDNAKISGVGDNATISDVWDNATISDVWDNAKISDVWDNATISDVWDNAKIENDQREKK